jgi:ATP-dependent Zn protease
MRPLIKLRPAATTWTRVKRIVFLGGLWFLFEKQDPLPFAGTPGSWLLFSFIAFAVIREFFYYRLETQPSFVVRTKGWRARWENRRDMFDSVTRYRLRRFIIVTVGYFVIIGGVVSLFSERCSGLIQCGTLAPLLAIEQIPAFLIGALSFAVNMMQLAGVFVMMAKVGSYTVSYPGTIVETFDDVYGQDKARDAVREQVELLNDSERIELAGGQMVKGMLLWGPPGTGKTLLAKAAANLANCPLIQVPVGGFTSTFMGINFLKVQLFFREIGKQGLRWGGVLVFFDEMDSLGNRGGAIDRETPADEPFGCTSPWLADQALPLHTDTMRDPGKLDRLIMAVTNVVYGGGGGMNMGTLEAFLAGLDGMDKPRGLTNKLLSLAGFQPLPAPRPKFLLIGATNRIGAIDKALLRAGRIEEHVHVTYPDFLGKRQTYVGYLDKVDHDLDDVEIDRLARLHYQGTGAEIKAVVNKAVLLTFRHDIHPGTVTYSDIMEAMLLKRHGETLGTFERPEHTHGTAIHEAGHAVLMHHLRRDRIEIWFASIERRGQTGGMVSPSPLDDDWKQYHDEMLAQIAISLGSRVAELAILGKMSNGHGGDGGQATAMAQRLLNVGGHPDQIGQINTRRTETERIDDLLAQGLRLAEETLLPRLDQVEAVAALLEEKLTVQGWEIHELLDRMEAER